MASEHCFVNMRGNLGTLRGDLVWEPCLGNPSQEPGNLAQWDFDCSGLLQLLLQAYAVGAKQRNSKKQDAGHECRHVEQFCETYYLNSLVHFFLLEGSLEAKLPTMWINGKACPGRSSNMEKARKEKIRDGEDQRRKKPAKRRCRCAKRWESPETLFSTVLWLRRVEE